MDFRCRKEAQMNIPGFTAEASLPSADHHPMHRETWREFDGETRIVPARSWIGEAICEGALRECFGDNLRACRLYGDWCTLGGIFE
jgi:hypothetical protein